MSGIDDAINIRHLRSTFVINPAAGPVAARTERRQRVEDFVRHHKLDASIELSRRGGHAGELARAALAAGSRLVVSVGGDGTLNEVAGALVDSGALYGMVPTGSGNGLGRDLGLPLEFNRALAALLDGRVRTIDTGEVNGLRFFNVMGVGFDAEIGRRFNLSHKRGLASYLRIGLGAFFSYRRQRLEIEGADGRVETLDAFLASVANSTQYGNNARIAPRARLDDGALDLVAVTTKNLFRAIPLVVRLFRGTVDHSPSVRTLRGARFVIRRAAAGPIHTDGEVHDCEAELRVRVVPGSLRVVVPRDGRAGA